MKALSLPTKPPHCNRQPGGCVMGSHSPVVSWEGGLEHSPRFIKHFMLLEKKVIVKYFWNWDSGHESAIHRGKAAFICVRFALAWGWWKREQVSRVPTPQGGGPGLRRAPPDALYLGCLEPVRAGQAAEKMRFPWCMQLNCRTRDTSNSSILLVSQSCFKVLCMEKWGLGTSAVSQWERPRVSAGGASGQQSRESGLSTKPRPNKISREGESFFLPLLYQNKITRDNWQ